MSHLTQIAYRHKRDRLLDAFFIAVAALLIGVSVAALTTKAVAKSEQRDWTVTVFEGPLEIGK
jgi:hypothetical protein